LRVLRILAIVVMVIGIGTARADPILDFGVPSINPATAMISYAGGVDPLDGVNINVVNVAGLGTSLNALTSLDIFGGQLNFTTGNLTSSDATHWYFGAGGWLTITGAVDLNNNHVLDGGDLPSTTLLTGSFTSAQVVSFAPSSFMVDVSFFTNTVDAQLAAFFGESGGPWVPWWGTLNDQFAALGALPPNGFTSFLVASGDLTTTHKVPEPAGVALIGVMLAGLGFVRHRHRRQRSF